MGENLLLRDALIEYDSGEKKQNTFFGEKSMAFMTARETRRRQKRWEGEGERERERERSLFLASASVLIVSKEKETRRGGGGRPLPSIGRETMSTGRDMESSVMDITEEGERKL